LQPLQISFYNNDIIKGFEWHGKIYGNVGVGDLTYKLTDKKALRMELQHLYTKEYKKNWAWSVEFQFPLTGHFQVFDEYNMGIRCFQTLNILYGSFRYEKDGKSISWLYWRRVEGVVCIGGVWPVYAGFGWVNSYHQFSFLSNVKIKE